MSSSGHHCMSGIYNIGHGVMPWWISNCEQGQVLVSFYRHSTRMYLMKEKQEGPIPTGLKRWPLKQVSRLHYFSCRSSGLLSSELSLPGLSEVSSKGSKWVLHTLV